MRVLHIYKTYYPVTQGGCEQFIRTLTKYTSAQGCQNRLITLSPFPGKFHADHLEVICFPISFNFSSCPVGFELFTAFKHYAAQADIIHFHFHFPWPFADLLYLMLKLKKPTVVTYQSDIVRQRFSKYLYYPIMKSFLSRVDKIVLRDLKFNNLPRLRQNSNIPLW